MNIANGFSAECFNAMIELLDSCMDDYLYMYDLKEDFYSISERAVERFALPGSSFPHANEFMQQLIHPDDFAFVAEDLMQVVKGKQTTHNLQYRWLDRAGNGIWIDCRGKVFKDEAGEFRYFVGCINEIGMQPVADNISGLLGESSLRRAIDEHLANSETGFVVRLGIDNFKDINENKGVDYGNVILHETAACIEKVLLPGQKLYRIVADEFVILDYSGRDVEEAKALYERIAQKISEFIESERYEVFYTMSAGIVDISEIKADSYIDIMKLTEFSLDVAKHRGKNRYYLYDEKDYLEFSYKKSLTDAMRHATYHCFKGFEVYYQPIVDVNNHTLSSAEALLRFRTEDGRMISPTEFIPLLEESSLIIPVGKWVLNEALRACSEIQKKLPEFRMSVNLSYIQVLKSNVLEEIIATFHKYSLKPGSVMVELTESGMLESNANFLEFCKGLKDNGILLALDDFGTGYSNFHYLYNLSPDTIKIDRSFTLKALQNEGDYQLLLHMVNMAHSISLKLCIEGIENEKELTHISEIHPDYIQGYYFGKPCPFEAFKADFVED